MENFNQIFTLIAQSEDIHLNTNILETGLINIIALIIILLYSGNDFLGSFLQERKSVIVQSIEDAENRLNEAKNRLREAEKQAGQLDIVLRNIKVETLATKRMMLQTDAFDAKKDLKSRFERTLNVFKSKERQIFFEIKDQITSLVLSRTVNQVQETFSQDKSAVKLINNTIRTLELPS